MFFFLSRLSEIALGPLSWAMGFLVVGLFGLLWRRRRRARRRAWALVPFAAALAILFVFSLPPVSNQLVRSLEQSAVDTTKKDETYDAVILLGGALNESVTESWGGEPQYNESVERVLVTFELLRSGRARSALITGGTPFRRAKPETIEANVEARQLAAWGIDPARIVVEARSKNTHENATLSAPIIAAHGWRSLVLVTSAFHMKRAAGCFRAVGLTFDTLPVDYRSTDPTRVGIAGMPKAEDLGVSTMAIHEAVGRLVYRYEGYAQY